MSDVLRKVVHIGAVPVHGKPIQADVFCKVQINYEGRLSISGVVGPKSNGDCWGSCGQIQDEIRAGLTDGSLVIDEAWDPELVRLFLDMWDRWHLNDMHAGCEHQRALGWEDMAREKVKIYQWTLKPDVYKKKEALEEEALERARSVEPGRGIGFYAQDRRIMRLGSFIKTETETLDQEMTRYYEPTKYQHGYFAHVQEKARGWLTIDEDSRGLLNKPCPTCGYKYGSARLVEELPPAIYDWVNALPASRYVPAWV